MVLFFPVIGAIHMVYMRTQQVEFGHDDGGYAPISSACLAGKLQLIAISDTDMKATQSFNFCLGWHTSE